MDATTVPIEPLFVGEANGKTLSDLADTHPDLAGCWLYYLRDKPEETKLPIVGSLSIIPVDLPAIAGFEKQTVHRLVLNDVAVLSYKIVIVQTLAMCKQVFDFFTSTETQQNEGRKT